MTIRSNLPGVAARETFKVPGSASVAGTEPSIEGALSVSSVFCWLVPRLPRLFRARAMELWSIGRFANWWNTLRLRIIVYTMLELPKIRKSKHLRLWGNVVT